MNEHMERDLQGLTVRIDRTLCIGSGNCANLAPDVFELDEQNLVTFHEPLPDVVDRERVVEACWLCPVDALIATGEDGEQLAP